MTGRQRFLAAAQMKPVDTTPVWFMRQAGRSLPEYRALRERHDFMTVATTPELAARATLMPVDRLGRRCGRALRGHHAAVGLHGRAVRDPSRRRPGHRRPDQVHCRHRSPRLVPAREATPYVMEALRLTKAALGERAALLGFAGAPFTLACYLIEGRPAREFPRAKALMYGQPALWHRLMERLTEVTVDYLQAQLAAGADAVQLFDSWLGLLDPISYAAMVLPYTRRVFAEVAPLAPAIHFSTGTASLLAEIAASGCSVVSVDWRLPLDVPGIVLARKSLSRGISIPRWCLRRGQQSRQASATCWNGRAGGRGTYSISGMASFPRATPRRWRASLVSCMERLERVVIGESDRVRRSEGRWEVDWNAVFGLLREGKTAEIPCANERDYARRAKQIGKRAERRGLSSKCFAVRAFSAWSLVPGRVSNVEP